MSVLHRIFQAAHFLIALLFLLAGAGLIGLGALQLWEGVQPLQAAAMDQRLYAVLNSIAVLTIAVAALELGQTILEEEVHRKAQMSAPTRVRRFLSRFMVVLVVALSLETTVLVFRVAQEAPEQLPYVAAIGAAAALLLVAWGVFIRLNRSAEELEPEGMQAAKREDRKIEKSTKGEAKP